MKLTTWTALSLLACGLLTAQALLSTSSPTFYSLAIQLTATSVSVGLWLQLLGCLALLANQAAIALVFGRLRGVEVERLYERIWYSVTENLLALTIFRDDFGLGFVITFAFLTTLKAWHWILGDRVDVMELMPEEHGLGGGWGWHARILATCAVLLVLDVSGFLHYLDTVGVRGASLVFGFEYMILITQFLAIFIKYNIHSLDSLFASAAANLGGPGIGGWEDKALYLMLTDLVADFLRLLTYVGFFFTVLHFYGLPLHIIRDVYLTIQSFLQRIADVQRYLKAVAEMKNRYPDATREDVEGTDGVCIICREELADGLPPPGMMQDNTKNPNRPKKLYCGHIFHFRCLKSWLERQQSCPTCRKSVLDQPPAAGAGAAVAAGDLGAAGAAGEAPMPPFAPLPPFLPPFQPERDIHGEGQPIPAAASTAFGPMPSYPHHPGLPGPNYIVLTPLVPAALAAGGLELGKLTDAELQRLLQQQQQQQQQSSTGSNPSSRGGVAQLPGLSAPELEAQLAALNSVQVQLALLTSTMTRLLRAVERQAADPPHP